MTDDQPLWRLEPTDEMIAAACHARAGCEGKRYPDDYEPNARGQMRHVAREQIEAALAAQGKGDGLPGHHPGTCGTAYLTDERALRLIERMARHGAVDPEAMELAVSLSRDAGVPFARIALRRQEDEAEGRALLDSDLPF